MPVIPHVNTSYRLDDAADRAPWAIYLTVVLVSTLLGDTIILYSSIRYQAIKLNHFLVTVIHHLAVCDMLSSVVFVLPTLISLIADKWVLGEPIAYIHLYLNNCTYQITNYLISILACSKLLLLRLPHRTRSLGRCHGHVVCGVVWVLAPIYPAVRMAFDKHGLVFSYMHYNINFGTPSEYTEIDKTLMYVFIVMIGYIPFLLVFISTIGTLWYLIGTRQSAKQCGGEMRWQGIVTVVATATVYCIASLPDTAAVIVLTLIPQHAVVAYTRLAEAMSALNIMANFYIYFLTVPSFRVHVKELMSRSWGNVISIFRDNEMSQSTVVGNNGVVQERTESIPMTKLP